MVSAGKTGSSLVRQLGVTSAAALVVSNMIGTGIFSTSGFLAGQLGSPSLVLIIWLVGAACALLGSFCYSELGINYPSSGGEYVYLTRAFGPTWGFMTGWVSFFAGFSAPIAAAALAFAEYLGHFLPGLRAENSWVSAGLGPFAWKLGVEQVTASSLIAGLTILNCFNLRRVATVQNVLTALKITVLVLFIFLGLLVGRGSWQHFHLQAVRTVSTPVAAQFAISLFWIYVSYSGWNAATYVAEELKQPARTLPMALTLGTLLVAALYIGLNITFLYAASLEEMKGELAIGSLTASNLFGPQVGVAFSGLMALSLVATVNAMVTVGPRLYYAMAQNGAFFSVAAKVDEKRRTPVYAVLLQGLCATLMTVTPFPQLVYYIGFTLNFFAVLSVASLFIFRRTPGWQKLRVVSFAYPLIPAVFILVGLWMTIYGISQQPAVSAVAILTIVTGAGVYHLRVRSIGRNPHSTALGRV